MEFIKLTEIKLTREDLLNSCKDLKTCDIDLNCFKKNVRENLYVGDIVVFDDLLTYKVLITKY